MTINSVPERSDILDKEDRLGNQHFTSPWLEFFRSVGATRYIRECEALTSRTAISGA